MGSGITFSGFNNIDFNMILESVMQQARAPLTALETRQSTFKSQLSALGRFTSQSTTLEQAASDLAGATAGDAVTASTTDATAVGVAAGADAVAGRYDIVVQNLARAQVTASATTMADPDTTIAATGGSLTIGAVVVTLAGPVTLEELAAAINDAADVEVSASVLRSGTNAYRLVLTGKDTGAEAAYTVTNGLTDSTLTFGGNAVEAADATILVNNIQAVSSTNTFDSAVLGLTLTVLKEDPGGAIGINVTADSSALKARLETFVKAYNDLHTFALDQQSAMARGDQASLARDPMLRQVRAQLRGALTAAYGTGAPDRLSQMGLEFTLKGTLKLDATKFKTAFDAAPDDTLALLAGEDGAFAAVEAVLDAFTRTDGLLATGRQRLNDQIRALDRQLYQAQDRLTVQRRTLQQEFIAAELAMTRLRSQTSGLAGFGE